MPSKVYTPPYSTHTPTAILPGSPLPFDKSSEPPKKKPPSSNAGALGSERDDSLVITGTRQVQYKYNPGDEQWQRNACSTLGLVYVGPNRVTPGGPDIETSQPIQANRRGWELFVPDLFIHTHWV